ncbi:MAG TPA: isopentenyl transferase family protein [Candidatus Saccharimonadales bacterium]|nr:isopentenyl transferase family protein [Candidatus Saccharimonadales bacterium]
MSVTPEVNPIFFVVGATGSGKSGAAMAAAMETPGIEIVAADRYTAWAEMDIGTAKPTTEDRQNVPHHLVDIFHMGSLLGWEVGPQYQPPGHDNMEALSTLATQAFADISSRGGYALAVGGSPIMVDSLRREIEVQPDPEWQATVMGMTDERLFAFCEEWDLSFDYEGSAASVREKLIWYVEAGLRDAPRKPHGLTLGVNLLGRETAHRISGRIDQMWDEGLPQEVERLVGEYGWAEPLRRAIGYKEFMSEDGMSISDHDKARRDILVNTMALAWNQSVAFRKFGNSVLWLNHPEQVASTISSYIRRHEQTGIQPAEFTRETLARGDYAPR